jgi:uncharacterized protein (TIGR03437 family)
MKFITAHAGLAPRPRSSRYSAITLSTNSSTAGPPCVFNRRFKFGAQLQLHGGPPWPVIFRTSGSYRAACPLFGAKGVSLFCHEWPAIAELRWSCSALAMRFPFLVRLPVLPGTIFPQAFAQTPAFTSMEVVSAGSYAQPISPGSIAAIFGSNLATAPLSALGSQLSTSLGGVSVTVNGVKAPLFFVSPGQINFQVPSSTLTRNGTSTIVVSTSAGSSLPVPVPLYASGPGAFTSDGSGCGQAAALNIASDGWASVNSPSNSAAPGDYVSIFGTGFGAPVGAVPDGAGSGGPDSLSVEPGVEIARRVLTGL